MPPRKALELRSDRIESDWIRLVFVHPFQLNSATPIASANFIPSRVSGRGYKIGPVCLFICLFVCPSVSALTAEPFELRT